MKQLHLKLHQIQLRDLKASIMIIAFQIIRQRNQFKMKYNHRLKLKNQNRLQKLRRRSLKIQAIRATTAILLVASVTRTVHVVRARIVPVHHPTARSRTVPVLKVEESSKLVVSAEEPRNNGEVPRKNRFKKYRKLSNRSNLIHKCKQNNK